MTEEPPPYARPSPDDEPPLTLDEIVDRAGRRVATALVVAGAMVGLAIYWQPGPPRYQVVASGSQVLRVDTRSGTILACEGGQCATVVRHGQRLASHLISEVSPKSVPAPATAPAAPRAPAPSAAPVAPAAPAGR